MTSLVADELLDLELEVAVDFRELALYIAIVFDRQQLAVMGLGNITHTRKSNRGIKPGITTAEELEGELEGDSKGDSKGDFRGDFKQDMERGLLSSSGQVRSRSGLVQVWFRLQPKFNSFELDSEVGRLVWSVTTHHSPTTKLFLGFK